MYPVACHLTIVEVDSGNEVAIDMGVSISEIVLLSQNRLAIRTPTTIDLWTVDVEAGECTVTEQYHLDSAPIKIRQSPFSADQLLILTCDSRVY